MTGGSGEKAPGIERNGPRPQLWKGGGDHITPDAQAKLPEGGVGGDSARAVRRPSRWRDLDVFALPRGGYACGRLGTLPTLFLAHRRLYLPREPLAKTPPSHPRRSPRAFAAADADLGSLPSPKSAGAAVDGAKQHLTPATAFFLAPRKRVKHLKSQELCDVKRRKGETVYAKSAKNQLLSWAIYDRQNREAASIILADPVRYAGLPVIWAQAWLQAHPASQGRRPRPVIEAE